MDKRAVELISGIASGVLGPAGLAYALFGPTCS